MLQVSLTGRHTSVRVAKITSKVPEDNEDSGYDYDDEDDDRCGGGVVVESYTSADQEQWLWQTIEICAADTATAATAANKKNKIGGKRGTGHRHHDHVDMTNKDTSGKDVASFSTSASVESSQSAESAPASALAAMAVYMDTIGEPVTMQILGRLASNYPALARSLRELLFSRNHFDDGADLGAFATLATQLQAINFWECGLTSVRGLEGRCESLRKVNFRGCEHLSSLDGLGNHHHLEEVNVAFTAIPSVEPLLTCHALVTLDLNSCTQLTSLEGLQYHNHLKTLDAARTPIASVESLLTCPTLTMVDVSWCHQLVSLDGLQGHQWLEKVDASGTPITSIEPLSKQACPSLVKLFTDYCPQLAAV